MMQNDVDVGAGAAVLKIINVFFMGGGWFISHRTVV